MSVLTTARRFAKISLQLLNQTCCIRVDWKWRTWKWLTVKIAVHEIAGQEYLVVKEITLQCNVQFFCKT